jgi:type IV pilus assembly protein PilW
MIALVLGLLVVAAAIGIFLSNQQTYRATESVGRIQENSRVAFELMARDIREAGGNPCNSTNMSVINVLNSPANNWWSNWGRTSNNAALGSALVGYGDGDPLLGITRVAGTPALVVLSGGSSVATVVTHVPGTQTFTVRDNTHGFEIGDLLLVCGQDSDVVSLESIQDEGVGTVRLGGLFQMSNAGGSTSVMHAAGGSPGNAAVNLGPSGTQFTYGPNSVITRLHAAAWYIGSNGQGQSLYQSVLGANGGLTAQEIVPNVQAMALTYLLPGANSYVAAGEVPAARWNEVLAVRIVLTLQGEGNTGTDGAPITRDLIQVVSLRNRSL